MGDTTPPLPLGTVVEVEPPGKNEHAARHETKSMVLDIDHLLTFEATTAEKSPNPIIADSLDSKQANAMIRGREASRGQKNMIQYFS